MFARIIVLAGFVTLSASAQTPAPQALKPPSSGGLCQQIATAAFEANRGLRSSDTFKERSAPFVSKWLVQRALAPDASGGLRQIGRREECGALPAPCRFLGDYETSIDGKMDIPGMTMTFPPGIDANYVEWVNSVGMFPAGGEFLDVRAQHDFGFYSSIGPTGAFLKSVVGKQGTMCAFDNRLHESYDGGYRGKETAQTCAGLLSDDSEILKPDETLPPGLNQDTFWNQRNRPDGQGAQLPYDGSGTYIPKGIVKADVDGDGTVETLVQVLWSAQGDRCSRTYYDVLDSSDPSKLSSAPVRALVQGTQGTMDGGRIGGSCNTESRIRRKRDRIMFEYSGLAPVETRGVPIVVKDGRPLERTLREVTGGKVQYLCSTTFAVEPVIRYAR